MERILIVLILVEKTSNNIEPSCISWEKTVSLKKRIKFFLLDISRTSPTKSRLFIIRSTALLVNNLFNLII